MKSILTRATDLSKRRVFALCICAALLQGCGEGSGATVGAPPFVGVDLLRLADVVNSQVDGLRAVANDQGELQIFLDLNERDEFGIQSALLTMSAADDTTQFPDVHFLMSLGSDICDLSTSPRCIWLNDTMFTNARPDSQSPILKLTYRDWASWQSRKYAGVDVCLTVDGGPVGEATFESMHYCYRA